MRIYAFLYIAWNNEAAIYSTLLTHWMSFLQNQVPAFKLLYNLMNIKCEYTSSSSSSDLWILSCVPSYNPYYESNYSRIVITNSCHATPCRAVPYRAIQCFVIRFLVTTYFVCQLMQSYCRRRCSFNALNLWHRKEHFTHAHPVKGKKIWQIFKWSAYINNGTLLHYNNVKHWSLDCTKVFNCTFTNTSETENDFTM